MDDSQKISDSQNLNNQQQIQGQPVNSPIGIAQKEQEPIVEKGKVSDFLSKSEQEPILHEEVEKSGVEKVNEKFPLTKEHEELGIQHARETMEPHTEPKGTVQLLNKDEAKKIEKEDKNTEDSQKWLARLFLKVQKVWQNIKGPSKVN